jgi:broad specificity phosphatase PhoE
MLYFIRHGETAHNVNHILTGRMDIPLNENGQKQVDEEAERCKDMHFDVIFCSPLDRAVKTCSAINKYHNSPVIVTEEVIERTYGKYEGKSTTCIDREKCWNYFADMDKKGIETPRVLFGRIYEFLDKIREEYKDKDVLIVAHNGVGRAIYCYFNGIPEGGNLLSFEMPNARVIAYKFEDAENN